MSDHKTSINIDDDDDINTIWEKKRKNKHLKHFEVNISFINYIYI